MIFIFDSSLVHVQCEHIELFNFLTLSFDAAMLSKEDLLMVKLIDLKNLHKQHSKKQSRVTLNEQIKR